MRKITYYLVQSTTDGINKILQYKNKLNDTKKFDKLSCTLLLDTSINTKKKKTN